MSISAVVLAKNEEKDIEECLKTLEWCDETIVVDDYSTDKTKEIAKRLGAVIYERRLAENFAAQRNFGLGKAKGNWVLFVDADERVSSSLRDEICKYTNKQVSKYDGFFLKRVDFMWGKALKYGEIGNIKLLRLIRKDAGKWTGNVHEVIESIGSTDVLKNPLLHYPHQTLKEFLEEINFYTDIRSKELFEKGVRTNFFSILFYPKAKFIQNYILRLGLFDGVSGLVIAIMMSFHSFLVRGKLWLLWQKK